jgi:hypothetical protein
MHLADICTPFGLFEFCRMRFGLHMAGNLFQRLMDRILAGLPFFFCYLDDIIIASRIKHEHLEHLRAVFTRLRDAGLVINTEKCILPRPPSSSWTTSCLPPVLSPCAPILSRQPSASCRLSWAPSTSTNVSCRPQQGSSSHSQTCSSAATRGWSRSAWPTHSEQLLWQPNRPWQQPLAWHNLLGGTSSADPWQPL